MIDTNEIKHGYGHDPLPLTREQVAQFLIGQLTLNSHMSRDAIPEAHCISQAGMSVDFFMQARICGDVTEDSISDRDDYVAELVWIAHQLKEALRIKGVPPTKRQVPNLIKWDAMPLVTYAMLVLPDNHEHVWLGFFFRYALRMQPTDVSEFKGRVINEISQAVQCTLAEQGRMAFNALNVEDPTPQKMYPADAELAQERDGHLSHVAQLMEGLGIEVPPELDTSKPYRKPH